MLGRVLQHAGLLSVPEERQLPRALQRGVQHSGFIDLAPAPAAAVRLRPPVVRGRHVLAMASAALVALALLPGTALSPELPPAAHAGQAAMAVLLQEQLRSELSSAEVVARASIERPLRAVRYRPASKIDDEVRRRVYEAVARSLELETS